MTQTVEQMLIKGQDAIFEAIKELRNKVEDIGIQRNEIDHIKGTLLDMKQVDEDQEERLGKIETAHIKNHELPDRREEPCPQAPAEKPLWKRCVEAVTIAAAVLLFGLIAFTLYINTPAFLDFQRTQLTKKTTLPGVHIP